MIGLAAAGDSAHAETAAAAAEPFAAVDITHNSP